MCDRFYRLSREQHCQMNGFPASSRVGTTTAYYRYWYHNKTAKICVRSLKSTRKPDTEPALCWNEAHKVRRHRAESWSSIFNPRNWYRTDRNLLLYVDDTCLKYTGCERVRDGGRATELIPYCRLFHSSLPCTLIVVSGKSLITKEELLYLWLFRVRLCQQLRNIMQLARKKMKTRTDGQSVLCISQFKDLCPSLSTFREGMLSCGYRVVYTSVLEIHQQCPTSLASTMARWRHAGSRTQHYVQ